MVRTLLPAEEMCSVLESLGDSQVLVVQQQQVSAAMKRSSNSNCNHSNSSNSNSNNSSSNNSSNNSSSNDSSSKASSSSSATEGVSAASAEDAAAVAARTLFMTHAPVALSTARLQRFLEELTGGCAVEGTQEKSRSAAGGATVVRLLSFVFDSPAAVAAVLASARPLAAAAARSSHDGAAATSEAAAVSLLPRSGSNSYRPFVSMRVARLQQWIGEAATLVKTPKALQREADQFMMEFDLKKQVERERLKRRQQTDDEGFTLVTSEGATAADGTTFRSVRRREAVGAAVGAAAAAGAKEGEKAENLFFQQQATAGRYVAGTGFMSEASKRKKRRRGGTEDNFYRFQLREKKRKEFAERLQSVAEEEKVVAAMEKAGKVSVL